MADENANYGKTPSNNVVRKTTINCGDRLSTVKPVVESRVVIRQNVSASDGYLNGAIENGKN